MEERVTRRSVWSWGTCGDLTAEDARNQQRFAVWALAWAVSFVLATFLLATGQLPAGPLTWLVAVTPTVFGAAAVWRYVVFVRDADELLRRIHLEALAWGFGTGALFMMGYRLLERAGAPELDMNDPLLIMTFVWAFALFLIPRRYR
jgi:hypothetical protein